MDELTISGRRYISSRRLAKEHGYHSDYIGQLIRGGKVTGQKVGRAWYVDAASFDAYLGKEGVAEAPQAAPAEQPIKEPAVAASIVEEKIEEPLPIEIEEDAPSEKAEQEEAHTVSISHEQVRAHVGEERARANKNNEPEQPIGLRYYADDEPMIPQIPAKHPPVFAARINEETLEAQEPEEPALVSATPARPRQRSAWRPRHTLGLAVLGGLALIIAAAASSAAYLRVNADGQTANASYGFDFKYPASFIQSVK